MKDGEKVLGAKQILHFQLEDITELAEDRYEEGREKHGDYWIEFGSESHLDQLRKEIDRIPLSIGEDESIEDYDEYFADALNRLLFARAVLSDDFSVG